MDHKGTVWGPPLWNVFFADARRAISAAEFEKIICDDDLNAFRIVESWRGEPEKIHRWAAANHVFFDSGKKSARKNTTVSSRPVKLLGVVFDCQLLMHEAVRTSVTEFGWRICALLRARRITPMRSSSSSTSH
eukprot:15479570-Alexandrium_andersonii.AAC.1